MKKIFMITIFIISLFSFPVYATEVTQEENTNIPSMSMEQYAQTMKARQAKVDIIKKNNRQITELKDSLKNQILVAANKVNDLRIDVSNGTDTVSDETIKELKELLDFLQEAKDTLESDVEKISSEIEQILDLISTKGMKLEQYDLLIEKQNAVIVKMKEILEMVNKI